MASQMMPTVRTVPRPGPMATIMVEYDNPNDTGSNLYRRYPIDECWNVLQFRFDVGKQLLGHDRVMLVPIQGQGGGYDRRELRLRETASMLHEMNRLGLEGVRVEERTEFSGNNSSLVRVPQRPRTQQAPGPPPIPPQSAFRNPNNNTATPAPVPRGTTGSGSSSAPVFVIADCEIGVNGESQRNIVAVPIDPNQTGPRRTGIERNRAEGGRQDNIIMPAELILELAKLNKLQPI
ncbi:hypothetical protein V8F20_005702 [Naviculisporaceae sp. PSN 640]